MLKEVDIENRKKVPLKLPVTPIMSEGREGFTTSNQGKVFFSSIEESFNSCYTCIQGITPEKNQYHIDEFIINSSRLREGPRFTIATQLLPGRGYAANQCTHRQFIRTKAANITRQKLKIYINIWKNSTKRRE